MRRVPPSALWILLVMGFVRATVLAAGQVEDPGWALAKSGTVPLVRVAGPSGDFDVFIETPAARRVLYGPMMHGNLVRLDPYWIHYLASFWAFHTGSTSNYRQINVNELRQDLAQPVYRVMANYTTVADRTVQLQRIFLRTVTAGTPTTLRPIRTSGMFGTTATFDRLPQSSFQVVLQTNNGNRSFDVRRDDLSALPVSNRARQSQP